MTKLLIAVVVAVSVFAGQPALAQRPPGGPMRIVLLVDSSPAMSPMITQFRAALNIFFDQMPGEPEILLISSGGHLRVREGPTTDRQKLHEAANGFASDGGGNVFLDTLLEADDRYLKPIKDSRPVFVILTTDLLNNLGEPRTELYNKFMKDFVRRGGRAHALIVRGVNLGVTSQIAENLVGNTGGYFETIAIANALPNLMKTMVERVALDQ